MSRRTGERRGKGRTPAWPGPLPWSQLRPGDEIALTIAGAPAQRYRVVALSLTDAAMAPPSTESSDPVLTFAVAILADPLSRRAGQRLIVTAVALARARR